MVKSLTLVCKVSLHAALLFVAALAAKSLPLEPNSYRSPSSHPDRNSKDIEVLIHPKERKSTYLGRKLLTTGSSLPDCIHACGACNPCKRVMVSFECSIAESCPVVYRCICKGKYHHVPSN